MIRIALPLLLLATTAATGAATEQRNSPREQAKLERALRGLQPGVPQNCVRSDRISDVRGFDGEILYVEGRGKVWRNKTAGSCNGLAYGDILVTRTIGRQYCSGDIVQTRSPLGGNWTGSCSLGKFVPYTK
jgi:hypothetical protein